MLALESFKASLQDSRAAAASTLSAFSMEGGKGHKHKTSTLAGDELGLGGSFFQLQVQCWARLYQGQCPACRSP